MLGFPEFIFDPIRGQDGWKHVYACTPQRISDPVVLKLAPHSSLNDMLELARTKLRIDTLSRAFLNNGDEVYDVDSIIGDELLIFTSGNTYCRNLNTEDAVVGGYLLQEKLGEGGFGRVMKGVHLETGEVAALKFISKKSFKELEDSDRVFTELRALRDLQHNNVIRMQNVVDHPNYICVIMEYAPNGELRSYVSERGHLNLEESRRVFLEILKGIGYCHSKNIVHRDLKLENILLDKNYECKIADFGLSSFVQASKKLSTEGGTRAYLAPEVYQGKSTSSIPFKIDVWSLGVILYAITQGHLPFTAPDKKSLEKIEKGQLEFSRQTPPALQEYIKSMLVPDPNKRPLVQDLLQDNWLLHGKREVLQGSRSGGGNLYNSSLLGVSTETTKKDECSVTSGWGTTSKYLLTGDNTTGQKFDHGRKSESTEEGDKPTSSPPSGPIHPKVSLSNGKQTPLSSMKVELHGKSGSHAKVTSFDLPTKEASEAITRRSGLRGNE